MYVGPVNVHVALHVAFRPDRRGSSCIPSRKLSSMAYGWELSYKCPGGAHILQVVDTTSRQPYLQKHFP
jgi:hypothetical protein